MQIRLGFALFVLFAVVFGDFALGETVSAASSGASSFYCQDMSEVNGSVICTVNQKGNCTAQASATAEISGGQDAVYTSKIYQNTGSADYVLYKAVNSSQGGSVMRLSSTKTTVSSSSEACFQSGTLQEYNVGAVASASVSNPGSVSVVTVNSSCYDTGQSWAAGSGYELYRPIQATVDTYVSSYGPDAPAISFSGTAGQSSGGTVKKIGSAAVSIGQVLPVAIATSSDGESIEVAPNCGSSFFYSYNYGYAGTATSTLYKDVGNRNEGGTELVYAQSNTGQPQMCTITPYNFAQSSSIPTSIASDATVGHEINSLHPVYSQANGVVSDAANIEARKDWINAKLDLGYSVIVTTYSPVFADPPQFSWPQTDDGSIQADLIDWAHTVNFNYETACTQSYFPVAGQCGGAGEPACPAPCDNDPNTSVPVCPAPCDNDPSTLFPSCQSCGGEGQPACPCDADPATPAPACPAPCDNDPNTSSPACLPPPLVCGTATTPPCPCGVSGTSACPLPCDTDPNNQIPDCQPSCDADPATAIPDCPCGGAGEPVCAKPCGGAGQVSCNTPCGGAGQSACPSPCDSDPNTLAPACGARNENFWCQVSASPSPAATSQQVVWTVTTGGSDAPLGVTYNYEWSGSQSVQTTTQTPVLSQTYSTDGGHYVNVAVKAGSVQAICSNSVVVNKPLTVTCEVIPAVSRTGDGSDADGDWVVDNTVLWSAYPSGGEEPYTYNWIGSSSYLPSGVTDRTTRTLEGVYAGPGTKTLSVSVTDNAGATAASSSCAVKILYFVVTCAADKNEYAIGETVTWRAYPADYTKSVLVVDPSASPTPGAEPQYTYPNYIYSWTFSDADSSSGANINKTYANPGVKTATVAASNGSATHTFSCPSIFVKDSSAAGPSCTLSANPQAVSFGSDSQITIDFQNFLSPVTNVVADCGLWAQTKSQPVCSGNSGVCSFTCANVGDEGQVTVEMGNSGEYASCTVGLSTPNSASSSSPEGGSVQPGVDATNFIGISIAPIPANRAKFAIPGNIGLLVTIRRFNSSVSQASIVVSRSKLDEPAVLLPSMPSVVSFPPEENQITLTVPTTGLGEGNYYFTASVSSMVNSSILPEEVIADNVSKTMILLELEKKKQAPEIDVLFLIFILLSVIVIISKKQSKQTG